MSWFRIQTCALTGNHPANLALRTPNQDSQWQDANRMWSVVGFRDVRKRQWRYEYYICGTCGREFSKVAYREEP